MKVNLAHLRDRSTSGGYIDFVVFEARSRSGLDRDNLNLLNELTYEARKAGYRADKSALAYMNAGRVRFFGDKDLVKYLSNRGVPNWTHYLVV